MKPDDSDKPQKRKGPDSLIKAAAVLSGIGWFLLLGALVCVGKAKPESTNVFGFDLDITRPVRMTWDDSYLRLAFIFTLLTLVLGIIAVIINLLRSRRKRDSVLISPVIASLIALAGIIKYLFFL